MLSSQELAYFIFLFFFLIFQNDVVGWLQNDVAGWPEVQHDRLEVQHELGSTGDQTFT